MRGGGGMVTFAVDGHAAAAAAVVDRLQLIANAVSLGSVESLATQPVASTHHDLTPEERDRRGIAAGLVRLSIGLEDPEDLIADLDQALSG
jgi:cystathionine beta-lyase/cystathionine gamma-synthase